MCHVTFCACLALLTALPSCCLARALQHHAAAERDACTVVDSETQLQALAKRSAQFAVNVCLDGDINRCGFCTFSARPPVLILWLVV